MSLSPESIPSLESELTGLAKASGHVVLSDLDHTLTDEYTFVPNSNNHIPHISSELVDAAQDHTLIVATGRRADNPAIPLLWESGLVDDNLPVIAENGGTIIFNDEGALDYVDLVSPDKLARLDAATEDLTNNLSGLVSDGLTLAVKTGRTMRLMRIQDEAGDVIPADQAQLANQMNTLLTDAYPELCAVDTGASVVLQHRSVSKGIAFQRYMELMGQPPNSVTVIGMGNADNDASIFETSDIRIGFSDTVDELVDVRIAQGAKAAPLVLRTISTVLPVAMPQQGVLV